MTVVRVLREPAKVAARTRERVEEVIHATGYTPDLIARGLASNRSGLIAAVIPVLTNSLIAEIMQGLTDALVPQGLPPAARRERLFHRRGRSARPRVPVAARRRHLPERRRSIRSDTVRMLKRSGIPVVEGGNLTGAPDRHARRLLECRRRADVTRYLVKRRLCADRLHRRIPAGQRSRARSAAGLRAGAAAARRESIRHFASRRRSTSMRARARWPRCSRAARRARGVLLRRRARGGRALRVPATRRSRFPPTSRSPASTTSRLPARSCRRSPRMRVPRYDIGRRAGVMLGDRLAGRTVRKRIVDTGFELVPRESA